MTNSLLAIVEDLFFSVLVLFVDMTPLSCTGQSRHEMEGCGFTFFLRKTDRWRENLEPPTLRFKKIPLLKIILKKYFKIRNFESQRNRRKFKLTEISLEVSSKFLILQ